MLDLDEIEREWYEATQEEKYHDGSGCGILASLAWAAPELIREAKAAREMRSVLADVETWLVANRRDESIITPRVRAVLAKYPEAPK